MQPPSDGSSSLSAPDGFAAPAEDTLVWSTDSSDQPMVIKTIHKVQQRSNHLPPSPRNVPLPCVLERPTKRRGAAHNKRPKALSRTSSNSSLAVPRSTPRQGSASPRLRQLCSDGQTVTARTWLSPRHTQPTNEQFIAQMKMTVAQVPSSSDIMSAHHGAGQESAFAVGGGQTTAPAFAPFSLTSGTGDGQTVASINDACRGGRTAADGLNQAIVDSSSTG